MLTNTGKAFLYAGDYWTNKTPSRLDYPDWNTKYELLRTNNQAAIIERHTNKYPPEQNYNYLASSLEIIVGTGTTAPTVQDSQLENEITSINLQTVSKNSRNAEDADISKDNPIIMHAIKTYYNSSLINSITINEIGLIAKDGFGYSYLLYRDVLIDPIIILPNETATISIIIK